LLVIVGALFSHALTALAEEKKPSPDQPLPQDTGAAGLRLALKQLSTTARLMHTTAHPDDEDGGMLTLEARGLGTHTLLMTLTRGEGGQNKLGSSLFDSLGVLRTLELLQSDRYYGVEQRFSHVADFGFSKTADETLQKWGGHDPGLGDIVRVIRTFRPDVLVARFTGTARDGHGNHQASAILTKEAFRAAADPSRFPEQIREGLLPWQAKKLYMGRLCWDNTSECEKDYTVKMNTGVKDPDLGMSYIQFALEGLRHQLSQGAAQWRVEPGDRFSYYKLVDSVVPNTTDAAGHEESFFDGMDTTLSGLAAKLGDEEKNVPSLKPGLEKLASLVKQATERAQTDSSNASAPLLAIQQRLSDLIAGVGKSKLSPPSKNAVLQALREKQAQAETALNLAMNVSLEASVDPPDGREKGAPTQDNALTVVSAGQKLSVTVKFRNGSNYNLWLDRISFDGPDGWLQGQDRPSLTKDLTTETAADKEVTDQGVIKPGHYAAVKFNLRVPEDTPWTRPAWHRVEPETESLNTVDDEQYATLPFPPPLLPVHAAYRVEKPKDKSLDLFGAVLLWSALGRVTEIRSTVVVPYLDEQKNERKSPLAVAPSFSLALEPSTQAIPVEDGNKIKVKVGVSYNFPTPDRSVVRLQVPQGWHVDPAEIQVPYGLRGEKKDFEFRVVPSGLREGRYLLSASVYEGGKRYTDGYSLITREDLGASYYYQPAIQKLSVVDVKVPRDLKIGYIMGAGDEIPTALRQLGVDLEVIAPDTLSKADFSRFSTVVLGIRAYDTQKEVVANNQRLLDYVSNSGTLIVQYNAGAGDFNSGKFTPFSTHLSRARVSVEEAPVEILAPQDSIFHFPNEITQKDFDGWIQERGLYFMDQWDDKFTPLLTCNDPGESPQKGGLLRAKYGKGTYIYTGYAFFRQLPAGVPGAVRLFVNLLAAGHEPATH